MTNQNYMSMLIEDFNSKINAILEIVQPLAKLPERVERIENRLETMENELKMLNYALRETNQQVQKHEKTFKGFQAALAK